MSTAPDMLFEFGGVPVGNKGYHFAGWWSDNDNGNVYFVDFDEGTTQATGKNDMSAPAKHLQKAIDTAGTDATIYLRPRAFASGTYGEDPQQITPYSGDAENFHIEKSKKNMSIIGCGKGLSHAAAHKAWIGGYSGLTTAVLEVRAPGCVIENLRAQPPSSGTGGIFRSQNDGDTFDGGNTTFINNDFHDGNTSGALQLYSTWQMAVIGNRFLNCDIGIQFESSYSEPTILDVSHNYFNAITTEVQADIHCAGGVKRFVAFRNVHACGQPAAGGANKYIFFGAASTGIIAGSYFGTNSTTEATAFTLNGVLQAGNHCMAGLIT